MLPIDPVQRRAERIAPAVLAIAMSAFVAGVVTAVITGFDPGLPVRWLRAWAIAAPAAVLAAYALRPGAMKVAQFLARHLR